jgi:hypothetical protein
MRNLYRIVIVSLKGGDSLQNQGVDGRVVLKWILKEQCVYMCTGLVWLRIGPIGELI